MTTEFNPNVPGAVNASTPNADESINREQFLIRYLNTVFGVYKNRTLYADKVQKKTLAKGAKSAIFYFTGIKTPKFMKRGEEAKGQALHVAHKTIELDDLMYCDTFVADTDEHMSVLDIISENAAADGIAIAEEIDKQISIMITKASGENFPVTNPDGSTRDGGTQVTLATAGDELVADKLVAAIKVVAQDFDEKNVPEAGRYLFMKPESYYVLLENDKLLNADYSHSNGDYATAKIKGVAGFQIVSTNLLVDEDTNSWLNDAGEAKYTDMQTKYNHDCSDVIMQAFDRNAVGMVMGRELKVEKGREYRAQGEFIMTTIFKGIDTLNPVGSAVIKKKSV